MNKDVVPFPSELDLFHPSYILLILSCSRFETEGCTFTAEKYKWDKGPGNIMDMWRDWAEGNDHLHFVRLLLTGCL